MSRWIRRVLATWALWRLLGPEPRPRFRPGQVHPFRWRGRTVFAGDDEFMVREAGDPDHPTLVLIHGLGDDSILVWHRIVPLLADRLHLVAIDQRNHGKSDWIREPYDVEDAADDIARVLAVLGLGPVAVAGYSMGGMVAQALAARHPALVDRLVLGGTAAALPYGRMPWRPLSAFVLWIGRTFERLSKVEFARIRGGYLHRVGAVPPEHARWLWQTQLRRDVNLYYLAAAAAFRFDGRESTRRIGVPGLVLVTTADQLVPPTAQYELGALLPKGEVVEVVGARHEGVLTHADAMAAAIADFLGVGPVGKESPR